MITEIDLAYAHAYRSGHRRLLITMEVTAWNTRLANGEAFPGESCVFFTGNGGQSWRELYLLSMVGDRCAKFSAFVLDLDGPHVVDGAGGELEYMGHSYELITDERVDFRNVTRLTDAARLRISNTDAYRQIHSNRG